MKFHCDRCKTRYSIADERVRGKILKIRCKNCSAVITVREGMGAGAGEAPPPIPEKARAPTPAAPSALRGAFAEAMERPEPPAPEQRDISPSQSFRAPDHFAEEWYLSIDGDQDGPFSLDAAKEWVAARQPDDELYCWKEDFDDWLPVDKVSHFRGLRAATPAPRRSTPQPQAPQPTPIADRLAAGPAQPASEPEPLFNATMKRIEAEERARSEGDHGGNGASADVFAGFDDDLDLDIGEASRVVKLEHIMRPPGREDAESDDAGGKALPGVAKLPAGGRLGMGTGAQRPVDIRPLSQDSIAGAQPPILASGAPKRSSLLIPLLIAAVVVAGAVGILLFLYASGDHGDDSGSLARSSVGGDDLGRRIDQPAVVTRLGSDEGDGDQADKDEGKSPTNIRRKPPGGTTTKGGNNGTTNEGGPSVPGQEGEDGVRPLSPSDVIIMSRKQALGNRRCYERALKKDPFLDVKKIGVKLTVAPSGVVTDVTLDSYASSFLGQCLAARIRKWSFRKSTKGITMNLTLSFEQAG